MLSEWLSAYPILIVPLLAVVVWSWRRGDYRGPRLPATRMDIRKYGHQRLANALDANASSTPTC
jgi:hypothetical protein